MTPADFAARMLSIGIETLPANIGHDLFELIEGWRRANRLFTLLVLQTFSRTLYDDLVVDSHVERGSNHTQCQVIICCAPASIMFR